MRYLLISSEGQSLGLAARLEREGHSCPMYIMNNKFPGKAIGLVSFRLMSPRPLRDVTGIYNLSVMDYLLSRTQPEIVIFDQPPGKALTDHIEKRLIPVIGSDPCLPTSSPPPTKDIRIAVDGWFNGQELIGPFGYHVQHTRLIPGGAGMGPEVSPMAVLSFYTFHRTQGFKDRFADVEMRLRATSYRGPITGYMLPDGQMSAFCGGFTECTPNFTEILLTPVSQFLANVVSSVPQRIALRDQYAASLRVTVWPDPLPKHAISLDGFNKENLKHVWPNDLVLSASGNYHSSEGGDGNIATLSARGPVLNEAIRRIRRTASNITKVSPSLIYRIDIVNQHECLRQAENIFKGLLTESTEVGKLKEEVTA